MLVFGLNLFYSGVEYTEKDQVGLECDITLASPVVFQSRKALVRV